MSIKFFVLNPIVQKIGQQKAVEQLYRRTPMSFGVNVII